MPSLSSIWRVRLKYGALFAPALGFSLGVAVYTHLQFGDQMKLSSEIGMLTVHLHLILILLYIVVAHVFFMLVGIFFPFRPHPAWTLGWAISLNMLCLFSIFVGVEFTSFSDRYNDRMGRFSIVNKYQRSVTESQLKYLYSNWEPPIEAFQHKMGCCGLAGYQDFNPSSGRYDVIDADNDKEDELHPMCLINITWNTFLRNKKIEYPTNLIRLSSQVTLADNEDVPRSCCHRPSETNCNKNIFDSDETKIKKNIRMKGCKEYLTTAIDKSHGTGVLVLFFISPWLISFYTCIVGWLHLRESQGLRWNQFRAVFKEDPTRGDDEGGLNDEGEGLEGNETPGPSSSLANILGSNKVGPETPEPPKK